MRTVDYNMEDDVRKEMNLNQQIRVFDTTLRDGEQTPGVSFTAKEKMEIALQLDKLGVDVIEAGFPINSEAELKRIKELSGLGLNAKVCGLARVIDKDIEACAKAEVQLIHTFVSTSDIHIKHQMNSTREVVKEKAVKAVRMIKDLGFACMFSAMDATRTELSYLIDVFKAVEQEGADIINVPDTVGVLNPAATSFLFRKLRKELKASIDVHCHNDYGLAVANTLAAVASGADGVQVTVNGLGERAGNTSLEQTVMALHNLYGVKTGINTQLLAQTSKLVEKYSFITMPPNTPIVGRNAFTHESGIHAAAMLKHRSTFEGISAESVGMKSRIVIGKHTGRHAVENFLTCMGYNATPEQIQQITDQLKNLTEKKKKVIEDDLIAIADNVLKTGKSKAIILKELTVFTGTHTTPIASVVLFVEGKEKIAVCKGIGPIDAAINAIYFAVGMPFELVEYNLKAISSGTDSLGDAHVILKNDDGDENQGEHISEDVVMASVNAVINAINKFYKKKKCLNKTKNNN